MTLFFLMIDLIIISLKELSSLIVLTLAPKIPIIMIYLFDTHMHLTKTAKQKRSYQIFHILYRKIALKRCIKNI